MDTNNTDGAAEMELAARCIQATIKIAAFQTERTWSDRQLLLQFPDLGSSKDWWAMRHGKLDGRSGAELLTAYHSVLAQIEAIREVAAKGEDLYDDLHPVCELARVLPALITTAGNDRVLIVQGEPGSGKTTAARLLKTRLGAGLVMIEASDAWGDNPRALLGAILRAMGVGELPESTVARLDRVLDLMGVSRRVLIVDEAHHLGPRCLNTLKSLVNQTGWGFCLLCIGTLWRKLERGAYEEARQLTTNRLAERIKLSCPTDRDCQRMLDRRLGMKSDLKPAAALLVKAAAVNGGLGFVRDVCKRLAAVREDGEDVGLRDVAGAIEKEMQSR